MFIPFPAFRYGDAHIRILRVTGWLSPYWHVQAADGHLHPLWSWLLCLGPQCIWLLQGRRVPRAQPVAGTRAFTSPVLPGICL